MGNTHVCYGRKGDRVPLGRPLRSTQVRLDRPTTRADGGTHGQLVVGIDAVYYTGYLDTFK